MATTQAAPREASAAEFDRSFEYCAPADGPQWSSAYRELKKSIERAGLFERQYGYYARMVVITWSMLALGFALLPLARDHGLYLLDALFLAVAYGQLGYLGHDGAHGEVFRDWRNNHLFCLIQGNLLMGLRPVAPAGDRFDEDRVGLDHLSFSVASRDDLERALRLFDEKGVPHGEISTLSSFGIYVLPFRDPDNIQVELTAPIA